MLNIQLLFSTSQYLSVIKPHVKAGRRLPSCWILLWKPNISSKTCLVFI